MTDINKIVEKLKYSPNGSSEAYTMPFPLKDSMILISEFFKNNSNNKLCIVFPTKEYAAQWLSVPTVLSLIEADFEKYKNDIISALENYRKGDLLILNNDAVVEWIGKGTQGYVFRHKEYNGVDTITINIKNIFKIQPAPSARKALSSYRRVIDALYEKIENPIDKFLGIQSFGNRIFQKNSICLISKHISFENSISEVSLNDFLINEYFKHGRIDENGESDIKSPLLITNNFCNLALFVTISDSISKIIIDGFSTIQERSIDFSDIDAKRIPTILITDLSELESYENIKNFGFDFFSFTKENIQYIDWKEHSPFYLFENKLNKYISFSLKKEICNNEALEKVVRLLNSIEVDDSNKELINLKIYLVHITNIFSHIAYQINENEKSNLNLLIKNVESQCSETRFYLGDSVKTFTEIISSLGLVLESFSSNPSEKCIRLNELLKDNFYDIVICNTEDELISLSNYFKNSPGLHHKPNVVTISEINDSLISNKPMKGLLTGWTKSGNMNRLFSSFIFIEITVLFYRFECQYLNSLQNRNLKFSVLAKSTINKGGFRSDASTEKAHILAPIYMTEIIDDDITSGSFDITEFEQGLNNAQYSRYIVKENLNDSVRAKRLEFNNDKFIFLTDSHGLLVLENFYNPSKKSLHVHKNRIENLKHGDVIAFLKTEREVLNRIVSKLTTPSALQETTKWIDLWKSVLRNYFLEINFDFNKLVADLREKGCRREPTTIRSWLFDELKIGPRLDDDLISIAIMANETELYNNIKQVRNAIRQMTGWRMKASDYVIEQLKSRIRSMHPSIEINTLIDIEDLGEVEILEIIDINASYDFIDIRNVNRLLEKAKI